METLTTRVKTILVSDALVMLTVTARILFFSLASLSVNICAQTSTLPTAAQIGAALTGGQQFTSIRMQGTMTSGSTSSQRTVPISIVIRPNGAMRVESTTDMGTLIEESVPSTPLGSCYTTRGTFTPKRERSYNCLASASWVMPTLPLAAPTGDDLISMEPVSASPGSVGLAVQLHATSVTQTAHIQEMLAAASKRTVILDQDTLLPRSMEYFSHPDADPAQTRLVHLDFSDYRLQDGFRIPFLIQKHLRGSSHAIAIESVFIVR